jgi:hypothetical protein
MDWQEALSDEPDIKRDSGASGDQIASSQVGAAAWSAPVVRRFDLDRTLSSPVSTPYTP